MPSVPILHQPCAFSSPLSHQGHQHSAHGDPVLLFLSSWTLFSLSPFPQMYTRCPVCLPPPFLSIFFLPLIPGVVCVVPSPSHALTITSLSFPHSLLQSPCWDPLLPLQIYHVSSPTAAESPNPPVSPHATLPSSTHLHSFFHPLHSDFQPVHHRAFTNSQPPLLILLQLFIFSFPEKVISEGTNILKPVELMGRAEGGHCFAVRCQELLLRKSQKN